MCLKGGGDNDGGGDGDQLARCKLWWGGSGMSQQVSETLMQLDDRKNHRLLLRVRRAFGAYLGFIALRE